MIRKTLRLQLEKEMKEKLEADLIRITEAEMKEEISVTKRMQEVKAAWETYCCSDEIPELVKIIDYDHIFDSIHSKEDFEPSDGLKKEMIALSLINYLCKSSVFRRQSEIWAWFFVRVSIGYEKGFTDWSNVKYALDPIEEIFPQRQRVIEIANRLIERILETPTLNQAFDDSILKPISIFSGCEKRQGTIKDFVVSLSTGKWISEIYRVGDNALERLQLMLKNLPDPRNVKCEDAIKRIVELYKKNLDPSANSIPIESKEDRLFAEHIRQCGKKCSALARCFSSITSELVLQWSDRPKDFTEKIINRAQTLINA
ncbi:MAG: hypothetical protein V1845_02575 [bacterium]